MTTKRKVYMGCDGFGEDLKNAVKSHLEAKGGYEIQDFGTDTYFDAAAKVGTALSVNGQASNDDDDDMGVLVCGTGMGVGMVANKFPGVRAATVEHVVATKYARAVNDANVLCLGQLVTTPETACELVDAFTEQTFISQPPQEDGQPAEWWTSDVEEFLTTSKLGIARVERDAAALAGSNNKSSPII